MKQLAPNYRIMLDSVDSSVSCCFIEIKKLQHKLIDCYGYGKNGFWIDKYATTIKEKIEELEKELNRLLKEKNKIEKQLNNI